MINFETKAEMANEEQMAWFRKIVEMIAKKNSTSFSLSGERRKIVDGKIGETIGEQEVDHRTSVLSKSKLYMAHSYVHIFVQFESTKDADMYSMENMFKEYLQMNMDSNMSKETEYKDFYDLYVDIIAEENDDKVYRISFINPLFVIKEDKDLLHIVCPWEQMSFGVNTVKVEEIDAELDYSVKVEEEELKKAESDYDKLYDETLSEMEEAEENDVDVNDLFEDEEE